VLTDLGYRLGIFNEEAHLEWAALRVGVWATERPVSKLTAFRLITGGRVFILPSDHFFSGLGSLGRIFVRSDARRDRLRDELRVHARATLYARLPVRVAADGAGLRLTVPGLQTTRLAVGTSEEAYSPEECVKEGF
jgi:hypothetical protein